MVSYRSIFAGQNLNKMNLFTPKQVAEKLQLSIITVYSYIKTKQLIAIKIGRSYRITENDLNNFLKINKTSL